MDQEKINLQQDLLSKGSDSSEAWSKAGLNEEKQQIRMETAAPPLRWRDQILRPFSRITSSGRFIPEIDGFRFIAILSVFLYHLTSQMSQKSKHFLPSATKSDWLAGFTLHGKQGVPLFFVISGFILGLPFAIQYLSGGRAVNLRQFYLRRITRLEPPYILAMLLLAFALAITRIDSVPTLLAHMAASMVYLHGLLFGRVSTIDAVAWSLEVEVQFYLLAPVLALLFKIKDIHIRRTALIGLSMIAILVHKAFFADDPTRFVLSLLNYLQYFLMGFLLADIYIINWRQKPERHRLGDAAAVLTAILMLFVCRSQTLCEWLLPWLTVAFYMACFRSVTVNALITNPWITTIGGMCYSIYLLHYAVISLIYRHSQDLVISHFFWVNLLLQALIVGTGTLLIGSLYFLAIEKPCMQKDWPQRLMARIQVKLSRLEKVRAD